MNERAGVLGKYRNGILEVSDRAHDLGGGTAMIVSFTLERDSSPCKNQVSRYAI